LLSIVAVIALAVLVIGAGLALAARTMAQNGVTIDQPVVLPSTPDAPKVSYDLGVRTLPLLSDAAKSAWATNSDQALDAAGSALFGAKWADYLTAVDKLVGGSKGWAGDQNPDGFFANPSKYKLGTVGTMASEAVAAATDESQVLDVIGLAQLGAARSVQNWPGKATEYSHLGVAAAVLMVYDNQRFASCDSSLSLAYSAALELGTSENDNVSSSSAKSSGVSAMFAKAVGLCGDDPTPAVELVRWHLGGSDYQYDYDSTYSRHLRDQHDWKGITAELDQLQADWPNVPAAQLAIADAYRWLSINVSDKTGTGPYTAQDFLNRSIAAYQAVVTATHMPNAVAGLAEVLIAAGRYDDAANALDQVTDEYMSASIYLARADLAGYQHDYVTASQYEQLAVNAPAAPAVPIAKPAMWSNTVSDVPGVVYSDVPLGHGDDSGNKPQAETFTYTPQYRTTRLYASSQALEYAFLANDTQVTIVTCNDLGYPINYPICGMVMRETTSTNAGTKVDISYDYVQNLYRKYGDYAQAAAILTAVTDVNPKVSFAWERLGEIGLLKQDWQACAQDSALATYQNGTEATPDTAGRNTTGPGWALLRKAVCERQLGQYTDAAADLALVINAQHNYDSAGEYNNAGSIEPSVPWHNLLAMYVAEEQGRLAFAQGDYKSAFNDMTNSISLRQKADADSWYGISSVRGDQEQIASLSACQLGKFDNCVKYAQAAVDADPYSPQFAQTLADAKEAATSGTAPATPDPNATPAPQETSSPTDPSTDGSDKQTRIDDYRHAVASDPSQFVAWNNLGVLQAQTGRLDTALDSFKHAVLANPDYAIGWFNLGVLWAQLDDFPNFLRSQGALGLASILDPTLKGQVPVFRFDQDTADPIPQEWQQTTSARPHQYVLLIGLFVLIALGLLREAARIPAVRRTADTLLARAQQKSWFSFASRVANWRPHWIITTVISFAALVYVAGLSGRWEYGVGMVICAALLLSHMLAPGLAGQRYYDEPVVVSHSSFLPASLVTLVTAPLGFGFAPPAPIAETDYQDPLSMNRAGIAIVSAAGLLYAAAAWYTGVPIARIAAMMCLILVASAFLPIRPLDGSILGLRRWITWALTIIMLGFTMLFALKII